MRLIDADDVKKMLFDTFEKEKDVISSYWVAGTLADKIDEVRTAYDVDKVVTGLYDKSFERYGNSGMGGELVISLDDAVEIVKRGGVDER